MIASDPQKMLFAHASWSVKTDRHSPFNPFMRRCDDQIDSQFDRRPLGAVSILRGGLALELSPCRGALQTTIRSLAEKTWSHPVTGRDVRLAPSTIASWYYTARRQRDDPVGALRRAVRKDRGKISLAPALAERLHLQYCDHQGWSFQLHYDNLAALVNANPSLGRLPSYSTVKRYMQAHGLVRTPRPADARQSACSREASGAREIRSYGAGAGCGLDLPG